VGEGNKILEIVARIPRDEKGVQDEWDFVFLALWWEICFVYSRTRE
jgi:hypothetical protein